MSEAPPRRETPEFSLDLYDELRDPDSRWRYVHAVTEAKNRGETFWAIREFEISDLGLGISVQYIKDGEAAGYITGNHKDGFRVYGLPVEELQIMPVDDPADMKSTPLGTDPVETFNQAQQILKDYITETTP